MRNPFQKRRPKSGPPAQYVKLNLVSLEVGLARKAWVMVHSATGLYYSAMALSCVTALDMATLYESKESAERARSQLAVTVSASLSVVNLMDHVAELVGKPSPNDKEGWEDIGLQEP